METLSNTTSMFLLHEKNEVLRETKEKNCEKLT